MYTDLIHQSKGSLVGASRVARWLKIHLPMQWTWFQPLLQEDSTCLRATIPYTTTVEQVL